jgi:hypothetical protein
MDKSSGAEGTDLRRGGSRALFPAFSDRTQTLDFAPQFLDFMSRGFAVLEKLSERPLTRINLEPFEDIFVNHLLASRLRYADVKEQPLISEIPTPGAPPQQPSSDVTASTTDPWAGLLDAGLKLIETFATGPSGNGGAQPATTTQWIETDPSTGKSYMKLPIPEPDKVRRVTEALSGLIASLKR